VRTNARGVSCIGVLLRVLRGAVGKGQMSTMHRSTCPTARAPSSWCQSGELGAPHDLALVGAVLGVSNGVARDEQVLRATPDAVRCLGGDQAHDELDTFLGVGQIDGITECGEYHVDGVALDLDRSDGFVGLGCAGVALALQPNHRTEVGGPSLGPESDTSSGVAAFVLCEEDDGVWGEVTDDSHLMTLVSEE